VVTHPMVIRAAVVHCLRSGPGAFRRIDIEPLSVTDLRRYKNDWTLRSIGVPMLRPERASNGQ